MKKTVIILLCSVALCGALVAQNIFRRNATQQQAEPTIEQQQRLGPQVTFQRNVHDFGTVQEELGRVGTQFQFTNSGTTPIIIHRIGTGCPGCTFADYPREPILPGQSDSIRIEYATTGRPGAFNRPITVHTNVPDTVFTLFIRGTVAPRQQ